MTCRYKDSLGHPLHERDIVMLDKPGTDGKVIGQLEFYASRGIWAVRVQKVFSTRMQQFVPGNPGAVDAMAAIGPHVRLFSRCLKNVYLLEEAPKPRRRSYLTPEHGPY